MQVLIDSCDVTSRVSVYMPSDFKCSTLDGLRAVAITRRPREWNAMARTSPSPPFEHPVISTLLLEATVAARVEDVYLSG